MKSFLTTLCLFVTTIFFSYSQTKYGNVTVDELKMKVYPQDTTAAAVILSKVGETNFRYSDRSGFQFEYTLYIRIKILKSEGLDLANYSIFYTDIDATRREQVNGLSGTTYNLENEKVVKTKLSKDLIYDEDSDSGLKLKKFTMPAARVGSVIEFKYTLVSDFFASLPTFEFQSYVPIMYTSYGVSIPEYYNYNVDTRGYEKISSSRKRGNGLFIVNNTSLSCTTDEMIFSASDVPALKNEPYLWALDDYKSKVTFELQSIQYPRSLLKSYTTTWASVDDELLKYERFGGNLKKTSLFKNEIAKGEATLEKAREIQNDIKAKVKWNESRSLYSSNIKDALKNGVGSSSDLNFLLINALKSGGFNAFPVVLRVRDKGILPFTHPSIDALNYVIAGIQVDTMLYFTDASAKYGDWNLLPEKCMVERARIVVDNNSSWVDLSKISTGATLRNSTCEFVNSALVVHMLDTRRGKAATDFKSPLYDNHKSNDDYLEKLSARLEGEVLDWKALGLTNTNEDLKIEYTFKPNITLGDEYIYLNPMVEKHISENPFKAEERKFPINFDYLKTYIYMSKIEVPDGYTVVELPVSERFTTEDKSLSLTYRIVQQDDKISIVYNFQLNNLMFNQNDYLILRDFFAKVVKKNSEQIVLKKIG